jgi:molecular chaperone GrpE
VTSSDKEKPNSAAKDFEEVLMENGENSNIAGAEISSLMAEIEEKNRLLEETLEKHKRLQADFDNFRKRTAKEKGDISVIVAERIVSEFLPVMDNFERALSSQAEEATSLLSGVEMIFRQLNSVLTKIGVEQIQAIDCQFDPAWHEAVMRVEDSGKPEGTIICEIQKGYKLHGRIIRASMVQVVG